MTSIGHDTVLTTRKSRSVTGWLFQPRVGGLIVLAIIITLLPLIFPTAFYYRIGAVIYIMAIAAIGINLLMGFAGQVSLGHAGFFGIGAYAVAIAPAHFGLPSWLGLLLGALIAGGLAWGVGRPILRLKGYYLAVATLGLGILVAMALNNESAWTGGPDGMSVARLELFGWTVRGSQTWYWVAGILLVAATWLALNIANSPTGRALRALHDSEVASQVSGVDVARYKLLAFVISAIYASVAGSLLALLNGFITPDAAGFMHSIELVIMVVLGGMGSIFGSILGAALLTALPQVLTAFDRYEHALLGLIMIAVMVFMPAGLVPSLQRLFRSWRR